ncbi:hypothetical protein KKF34_10620 [Myxococcota bacterium]|nr:hypothetical protein [Myxococcota bacterium]MBU1380170.1 hypothetical protein [Myxococcota bacterium]MBU1497320.1 hypothetical protein [Myxococcota bacterium]
MFFFNTRNEITILIAILVSGLFLNSCNFPEKDAYKPRLNTNKPANNSNPNSLSTGVTLIISDAAKSIHRDSSTGETFGIRYIYVFTKSNRYFRLPSYIGKFTPLKNPKPNSKMIEAHIKAHTSWFTTKHKMLRREAFNPVTGRIETFSVPEGTSLKASAGNPFGKHVWTLQYKQPDIHRIYHRIMFHGSAQQYIVDSKRSDNHIRDLTTRSGAYYDGLGCVHVTNHAADWLFREGMTVNTRFIFINSTIQEHKNFLNRIIDQDLKSGKSGHLKPSDPHTSGFYRNPMVRNILWAPKGGEKKDEIWFGTDGEIIDRLSE